VALLPESLKDHHQPIAFEWAGTALRLGRIKSRIRSNKIIVAHRF
jgi:hypothetical protein